MPVTAKQKAHLERVTRLMPGGYDPWATAVNCTFDHEAAQFAIDFFPGCLTHVKGKWAGQPIILEEWQQGVVANLFGWKRPDGTRRYRQSLVYIPRKNAKTTLAAGIALLLTFLDGEGGAEVYCAAANKEQAAISFDSAKGMVNACPALARRAQVFGRSITYPERMSTLMVLTGKASTKHGLNPHGIIIDELHAQKDRELVDTLTTAVGSREQPMILYLTTADFGRPSICNEVHDYASKVRDGVVPDTSFLPVIYEATREDDWTTEATWRKANPNLGVSVGLEFFQESCKKAQENPALENTFKRLHLNIITEQASRWLSLVKWDAAAGTMDHAALLESLKGQQCFGGLDLSSTTDLTCLSLVFPPTDERPATAVLPFFWAPRGRALEREKRDRGAPYLLWSRQGFLRLTEGDVIDYDRVRLDIKEIGETYNIRDIGVDRWASAQIVNQLSGDGFDMVGFGQGFASMSAPTKELEKLTLGGVLWHGFHPVLRYCAANVATEQDAAGNLKPSKKHSTDRIDGIVATVMGLGRCMARDLRDGKSIYDERGIEAI